MNSNELEIISKRVRSHIIRSLAEAKSGHPGGSLSATDILVALYFNVMNHKPSNPAWEERDIFILSKGHACPAHYAVLAEAGYFSVQELYSLRKCGSKLQGHPASDKGLPGVEVSSGSLGLGLSIGGGVVMGQRMQKKSSRVYVLMSDGEHQEGSLWEAVMAAGHYRLNNLCGIVDFNRLQIDGTVEDVMQVEPLADKYRAFNWHVIEIDGHNYTEILNAFRDAKKQTLKPTVIIAHTIKGKGVSFMENKVEWHGKAPSPEQCREALKGLE